MIVNTNLELYNIHSMTRPRIKSLQQGSVLFISLIVLLLLTIIGLSSMNGSNIELKMVSNHQEKQIANQLSQSGIEVVSCLSKTTDNNPLDKTYSIMNLDGSAPSSLYSWTYGSYDNSNVNPLNPAPDPATTCSADKVDSALKIAIRRAPDGKALRAENASSYDEIKCQNYIVDSRYQFATSSSSATNISGICREKINY